MISEGIPAERERESWLVTLEMINDYRACRHHCYSQHQQATISTNNNTPATGIRSQETQLVYASRPVLGWVCSANTTHEIGQTECTCYITHRTRLQVADRSETCLSTGRSHLPPVGIHLGQQRELLPRTEGEHTLSS